MSDISEKTRAELLLVSEFVRENKEELKEILMGKSCGEAKDNVKEFDIDAAFKRVEDRIEKLESLHKTDKPAEFEGPSVKMTTEELEEMVERHERFWEGWFRDKSKPLPKSPFSLVRRYLDSQDTTGYDRIEEKEIATSFLAWLDTVDYEIREKKK